MSWRSSSRITNYGTLRLRKWVGACGALCGPCLLLLAACSQTDGGDKWRAAKPNTTPAAVAPQTDQQPQTRTPSVGKVPQRAGLGRIPSAASSSIAITPGRPMRIPSSPTPPSDIAEPKSGSAAAEPRQKGWKATTRESTRPEKPHDNSTPRGVASAIQVEAHASEEQRDRRLQHTAFQEPPRAMDLTEAGDDGRLPNSPRGERPVEDDGPDEPAFSDRSEPSTESEPSPAPPSEPPTLIPDVPQPLPGSRHPMRDVLSEHGATEQFHQGLAEPQPATIFPEVPSDPSREIVNIPFSNADTVVTRRDFELRMNGGLITLIANDASLSDILAILAQDHGLNIVSSDSITSTITVTLRDVPLADALNAILSIQGLSWSRRNNIISISKISADATGGAMVQGRMVRVYPLSYVTGIDVEPIVQTLLSPVGQVTTMQSDPNDSRKSTDRLVVEDLPDYLERVDSCIAQLDRAPRQVQIEAHILEVELSTEDQHGVNLKAITEIANTDVSLTTRGFASPTATPAALFEIDGKHVDLLVEALKNTVDARTLASPHVLVTHGQMAKIQIGGKIGYRQSTTTETSTVQGVEFLDVGVVLTVTPYIGQDGQILMKVIPEVSDGAINLDTELPDETITTVDSTVLLNDGQGMVIGGLIREDDEDRRAKTPILGEMWMINKLFQKVRQDRARVEVIVVLVPRIVDCPVPIDARQDVQLSRAQTRLFHGPLEREYRPWEPELPEVLYRPGQFKVNAAEFHRTEGTRFIPENPRSGEYYLDTPATQVPVTIETLPIQSSQSQPSQSQPKGPAVHADSRSEVRQVSAETFRQSDRNRAATGKPSFFGSDRKAQSQPVERGTLKSSGSSAGGVQRSVPNAPQPTRPHTGR